MQPMRIKIGDREWPSRRAAAKALGFAPVTIDAYLDRGIEHYLLEGRLKPKPGRSVTIDGVTYPSASAAARAIGRSHTYVLRKYGAKT